MSERRDISERLRLRTETRPTPTTAPAPKGEVKRMKTSVFIDPEVLEALDTAFAAYNYENRDAPVKKAAFMEEVLKAGMAHSNDVREGCRRVGAKLLRRG